MISSRKLDQCLTAAAAINEHCGEERAFAFACNAGYKEQLQALVNETHTTLGPIDILIGNAGVNPFYGPMSEIPDEAYDKIMSTNVKANLWLANMVAPDMVKRGSGSIMITSSTGAFSASLNLGTYNISKLAVIALVRNLAAELGPHGSAGERHLPRPDPHRFRPGIVGQPGGRSSARTSRFRCVVWERLRISRGWRCSSPLTPAATSPARRSPSVVARICGVDINALRDRAAGRYESAVARIRLTGSVRLGPRIRQRPSRIQRIPHRFADEDQQGKQHSQRQEHGHADPGRLQVGFGIRQQATE